MGVLGLWITHRWCVLPSWYTAHEAASTPTSVLRKLVPANPTLRFEPPEPRRTSTSNHTRPEEWHRKGAPADM